MMSKIVNSSEPATDELPRLAARGAAVTFGGQILRFILQLVGIVVLSRMLGPAPVGLFALVMVVVGVGEVLRDFGLSAAAIQAKSISVDQRSNLFWINLCLGIVLCAACIAVGPSIAQYYNQPSLTALFVAISAVFVLNGFSTQYRAGLTRELRFGALAITEILSMTIGLLAAVASALMGIGIWALAVQQLVQALTITTMSMFLAHWIPGRPRLNTGMRSLLNYGWNVGASQLINYLSRNIDTVIIGRQFGVEPLGFYNRAYQMLTLPLNQISIPATKVALPVLSRVQEDKRTFEGYLLRAQATVTVAVSFLFVFCAAVANPLVDVVLGPAWQETAVIFQILAGAGIVQSAAFATYWVFLAKAKTASSLRYTLFTKSILVAFVVIGANWGVPGVAMGYTLATALAWPIGLFWIRSFEGVPVMAMAKQTISIFALFSAAAGPTYAAATYLYPGRSIASLAVATATYCALLLILVVSSKSIRRKFIDLLSPVSHLRPKAKTMGTVQHP